MRVLTYNCCALPIWTGDIIERLDLIGEGLAALAPDVIVLQEIFFPTHLAILQRHLPDYQLFTGLRSWRTFAGGLAVFSRHPLADSKYSRFRQQGSLLRYTALAHISRKGFISTTVRPASGPAFQLVATHPVADYRSWRHVERPIDRGDRSTLGYLWKLGAVARGDPYPALQASQMAQLAGHVARLPTGRPVLVAGDLNVTPESAPMQQLIREAGLEDCMAGDDAPSFVPGTYYRLPHDPAGRRIDYVLHRAGAEARLDPVRARYVFEEPRRLASGAEVTLSDHFGLLVEFRPG